MCVWNMCRKLVSRPVCAHLRGNIDNRKPLEWRMTRPACFGFWHTRTLANRTFIMWNPMFTSYSSSLESTNGNRKYVYICLGRVFNPWPYSLLSSTTIAIQISWEWHSNRNLCSQTTSSRFWTENTNFLRWVNVFKEINQSGNCK